VAPFCEILGTPLVLCGDGKNEDGRERNTCDVAAAADRTVMSHDVQDIVGQWRRLVRLRCVKKSIYRDIIRWIFAGMIL